MLATAVTLAEKAFDDGWYDRIQLILNWTEKLFCENHVNAWIRASQGWEGIITCPQLLQTCSTRDASPPPNRQGRSHTTQRKDLADCIPGNSRSRSSPAFIPETFDCNIQKQPTNVDPQCIVYPESNQFKHYMNLTNLECSLLKLRATEGFSGVPTTKMKEPIDCGTAPVQPSALDRNGEMPGAKYSDDEGDWVNLDEECRESESEGEKFQEKNCEISGFRFFPPPLEMGCYNLKDNEDFRFDEDLADCSKETKRGNRQPHSAKRPRTKKPKRLIQKIQHPEYQKPCFFNEGLHRQKTHKKTEFLGAPCEDALLPEKQDSKTKPASPTRADKENKNCGEVLPNQVPSEDKTEEAQSEDNSATGSPAAESTSSTMDSVDDNAAAGDDDVRPESDSLYVSAQTENAGLESVV
ncbi:hypothetical protein EB796_023537 [Bugula neritina]|uniref:Uncharacterized protein n=1 Tax=Bugula neritina TaxID=10212 RepID=A0A7J7IX98_BUGNE|nr:hypothetical protein EB796_023537 [Bugula neritina]